MKLGEAIYKATQEAAASADASADAASDKADDDVVDADFEEVDEADRNKGNKA
jgi:molecular chaperone DnaK